MKRSLIVLTVLSVLLSGCATGRASPPARTPSPTRAVPAGPLQPDPAAAEARSPDPNFDYGYVIQITPQGIHPATLLAGCCLPITFENLTAAPTSIVFDYQPVKSGPIVAGGTWVWTPPHIESIVYHTGEGTSMSGNLQVQQSYDS